MSIDQSGLITWTTTPSDVQTDPYTPTVQVEDRWGRVTDVSFNVSVVDSGKCPWRTSSSVPNPALPGSQVRVSVQAADPADTASVALYLGSGADGTPLRLGQDNDYQYSFLYTVPPGQSGPILFSATTTDAAGNVSTPVQASLDVATLAENGPTVALDIANGAMIQAPVQITGTACEEIQSVTWQLKIAPEGSSLPSDFRLLASGTSNVYDGALGQVDPTVLADGPYTLQLTATDPNGVSTTVTRTINISSQLKLGNFSLSFTDLTIPLGGTSITITRSYDTTRGPGRRFRLRLAAGHGQYVAGGPARRVFRRPRGPLRRIAGDRDHARRQHRGLHLRAAGERRQFRGHRRRQLLPLLPARSGRDQPVVRGQRRSLGRPSGNTVTDSYGTSVPCDEYMLMDDATPYSPQTQGNKFYLTHAAARP